MHIIKRNCDVLNTCAECIVIYLNNIHIIDIRKENEMSIHNY